MRRAAERRRRDQEDIYVSLPDSLDVDEWEARVLANPHLDENARAVSRALADALRSATKA